MPSPPSAPPACPTPSCTCPAACTGFRAFQTRVLGATPKHPPQRAQKVPIRAELSDLLLTFPEIHWRARYPHTACTSPVASSAESSPDGLRLSAMGADDTPHSSPAAESHTDASSAHDPAADHHWIATGCDAHHSHRSGGSSG